MRIVTKKEFLEFIFAQDDDRKLDFRGHHSYHTCGCPMVHFGKDLGFTDFKVGNDLWVRNGKNIARFEPGFNYYSFFCNTNNYGELKQILSKWRS